MNFIVIFVVLFIGFQIIKLKGNMINCIIVSVIIGCILYIYPKLFDKN
ncbi:conserved hypothetical protein [Clostridiaceae bacterium BL-3]|nr:conserved hypothetical protein [Clostridiaceae bacterium BL-3]